MSKSTPIVLADTITKLGPEARGAVIVAGSHGGIYAGTLALIAGARGFILNDAGVGRDQAGIGALALAEDHGVAACTVAHTSCRIGQVRDMWQRGTISHANAIARRVGIKPGDSCHAAAAMLTMVKALAAVNLVAPEVARTVSRPPDCRRDIVLVDSISVAGPQDAGAIVVSGSHGGLIGGRADSMLAFEAFAAVFNDAGDGADNCGTARLPELDKRGIAAWTVSAMSARIGDARSTLESGVISAMNNAAKAAGARVGQRTHPLVDALARRA